MTDDPEAPIAVIKVGGSLLDWPPLPARLAAYLAIRSDVRPVLVVGGGAMADVLRVLDRVHGLGDPLSHALALRVLDVTGHLLSVLLPGSQVVTSLPELAASWASKLVPILAPRRLLNDDDRSSPHAALPHSWDVTTDSISARVAELLHARELILIKSTSPPPRIDLSAASLLEIIDTSLGKNTECKFTISIINIKETLTTIHRLHPSDPSTV